jgi:hypothetical protein
MSDEPERMAQAPQAPDAAAAAPPLGQRPAEPLPGKASLADPQGKKAAEAVGAATGDGGGPGGGTCPDCGLPYRDHPDFSAAHGHRRHADFDPADAPGSPSAHEEDLPGEELDQRSLGGDPAGA